MDNVSLTFADGKKETARVVRNGHTIRLDRSVRNAAEVELDLACFRAEAGEDGYYLLPNIIDRSTPGGLVRFRSRPDAEQEFLDFRIPGFGFKKGDSALFAVVTGGTFDFSLKIQVRSGQYRLLIRFVPAGEEPEIELLPAPRADYAGMAEAYRDYQLRRGACRTLRERCADNPVLAETVRSVSIRIRMAWKPVPPDVLEQTPENAPKPFVAVTFDRACQILDECHRRGVEHAEFCLVGWNCGGHDGAFPDLFPVEPALGGEEGLRKLVEKARACGYLLGAHTNLIDSYSLSRRASHRDRLIDADGSEHLGGRWGGGQSYYLCPKRAYRFAQEDFPALKALGFNGPQYLDVATIVPPDACFAPEHPLSRREAAMWRGKSLALAREYFGASACEGSFDFCIDDFDCVLYSTFREEAADAEPGGTPMSDFDRPELCDEVLPFWCLVYHGIMLYNAHFRTINAMVQDSPGAELRNLALGGRPVGYFHSKFRPKIDNRDACLDASTDERLAFGADRIARCAAEYEKLWPLQYEFMRDFRNLAPRVTETLYADGTRVLVNRSNVVYDGLPANSSRIERME